MNRELSWLQFNERVLELAEDERIAAARAREVPRDLRAEPRRVLHGARGRAARPGGRGDRRARARRALGARDARADQRARARELVRRHSRVWEQEVRPELAEQGMRVSDAGVLGRRARDDRPALLRADLPGAHPARRRPRPAVPVHLEPVAVDRRIAARPGLRPRDVRAREGAEGGGAALRPDRERRVRAARGRDRPPPRELFPGDGDPSPRLLPGHARRGLHRLRRGGRPAARRRGRAAAQALRGGGAPRGGVDDGPGHAPVPDRAARDRRDAGRGRRGPARPRRPLGVYDIDGHRELRYEPWTPVVPPPFADTEDDERGRVRSDARRRRPGPPPLPLVRRNASSASSGRP